ncbi:unnamed protein product [Echinostoma caproni]|uniref:Uncharacterized protein n=1 Tax=Echinostoma caproni TaxID=27848 RepID=A0A183AF33_9TREM|nr:unnamed protein product [Echinostoma caproni]
MTSTSQARNRVQAVVKMMGLNDGAVVNLDPGEYSESLNRTTEIGSDESIASRMRTSFSTLRGISSIAAYNEMIQRRTRPEFFSVDRGRHMQYQLYRFNLRQKANVAKSLRKPRRSEVNKESRPKEVLSDFCLPLLEDPELLDPRKPWMLGVFDPSDEHAFEYLKFLQTTLSESTLRNRIALESRIRFTLPMDLSTLKGMTPMDYLRQYCKISENQKFIYSRCFGTMRPGTTLTPSDLLEAITNRMTGVFTQEQREEFTSLTQLNKFESLTANELDSLMALAERLYGIQNFSMASDIGRCGGGGGGGISVHLIKEKHFGTWVGYRKKGGGCGGQVPNPALSLLLPSTLEKADFFNLGRKLGQVELRNRLRKLLVKLEEVSRMDGNNVDHLLLNATYKSSCAIQVCTLFLADMRDLLYDRRSVFDRELKKELTVTLISTLPNQNNIVKIRPDVFKSVALKTEGR